MAYPDIVTMNFSLTVDPNGDIEAGSGTISSVVIITYNCFYFDVDGQTDVSVDGIEKSCSNMITVPFKIQAGGQ